METETKLNKARHPFSKEVTWNIPANFQPIRLEDARKRTKNGQPYMPGGGGGTPLLGLYGDVPLDRVGFFGLAVLNRIYNSTCLCPKQVKNLS